MLCRQDRLECSGQVGNKLTCCMHKKKGWLEVLVSVTSRSCDPAAQSVSFVRRLSGKMAYDSGSLLPHKVTAVNRDPEQE